MIERTDEHRVITVRVAGSDVDGVVVNRRWRDHYDARGLCETLSALLRDLSPAPADRPGPAATTAGIPHGQLTEGEAQAFWDEFSLFQRKLAKRREQALAGDMPQRPAPVEVDDPHRKAGARYVDGRFDSFGADPSWLESATMQDISDTFTRVLTQHPLAADEPVDQELADIERHQAAFMNILTGN